MPCDATKTEAEIDAAIQTLAAGLASDEIDAVIGPEGSIAFRGWSPGDKNGVSDICAFRRLEQRGDEGLRRSLMRAEALAGQTLNRQAVAAGVHSHDGGQTWSTH